MIIKKILQYIHKEYKKKYNIITLLIGLFIFTIGIWTTFVLGFHAFDMAQNLIFIRDDLKIDLLTEGTEWNPQYFESKISAEIITLEDTYSEGIKYLLNGIFTTLIGVFFIGYAVGKIEK